MFVVRRVSFIFNIAAGCWDGLDRLKFAWRYEFDIAVVAPVTTELFARPHSHASITQPLRASARGLPAQPSPIPADLSEACLQLRDVFLKVFSDVSLARRGRLRSS